MNLAIHIFNALLVYWLVVLTLRTHCFKIHGSCRGQRAEGREQRAMSNESSTMIAFFSALLFVSHPIQTQAVTYIVQRFTSLATFFYLLSIVMYIKSRGSREQRAKSTGLKAMCYTLLLLFSPFLP